MDSTLKSCQSGPALVFYNNTCLFANLCSYEENDGGRRHRGLTGLVVCKTKHTISYDLHSRMCVDITVETTPVPLQFPNCGVFFREASISRSA